MTTPSQGVESHLTWLAQLPLPAAVVRKERIIFANDALLALLDLPKEQVLNQHPETLHLFFPKSNSPTSRHSGEAQGPEGGAEMRLSLPGNPRALHVEVFSSRVGDDLLVQFHDVTDRAHRLEQLRSLARLGATVQRELFEDAIFRAVASGLDSLGAAVARLRPAGSNMTVSIVPLSHDESPQQATGPWIRELARAWDEGFVFVDDLGELTASLHGEYLEAATHLASAARGFKGAVVRLDPRGRPAELLLVAAPWLRAEDQPTLSLFAAQIGAALDAAGVVRDLSRRNAELTALNRVGIAAGLAHELHELFEPAAAEVARVTGCVAMTLYLVEEKEARLAWQYGQVNLADTRTTIPLAGSRLGEVVASRLPRVWSSSADEGAPGGSAPHRDVVISVPMIARSRVLGVIDSRQGAARPVSQEEIDVLFALASHLASAVETSRLVEDLRRRNDELSRAQAQLVQRERLAALGEMAAAVAHEVRNPLAVIFNLLTSLRRAAATAPPRSASGPDIGQLLSMLSEESERIDHLVSDLLDLARPTLPALAEVFLPLLIQESVSSVVASRPDLHVSFVNEEAVAEVQADPRLMRQVFVNLAINAVQAMPSGGRLLVRLETTERGGTRYARVTFEDSGHGIPEEVLPRIFEPFFTTRAQGTGLGLTLVKRILEAHHGDVAVRSSSGGAALSVEWPVVPPELPTRPP